MKKEFFLLFIICSLKSNAQLVSLVIRGDTLFGFNPSTGVYTQYTKLVPSPVGQDGKGISTNGSAYIWTDFQPLNSKLTSFAALANGSGYLKNNGSGVFTYDNPVGSGTVTDVSVASANGFSGSVATSTSTPAITINTTVTGILKSVSGSGISAAVAGDFPTLNQNTTGSAATLTTPRTINGASFDGSADITVNKDYLAYQALGSPILAETVNFPLAMCNTAVTLVDNQLKLQSVYLTKSATLTGVKVYMRTAGNYTGDQNNRIGLYSYSGGTLTLVASSTNTSTLWTASANGILTIPFSSTYAASSGLYYVAVMYNQSAQTTAPQIAGPIAINNLVMQSTAYGFANSAKLNGTVAAQNDLPATQAMTGVTSATSVIYVALY